MVAMVVVGELVLGLGEMVALAVNGEFRDVRELASDNVATILLEMSVYEDSVVEVG